MYHHTLSQVPLPEHRAIIAVERHELIEQGFFPCLEGHVSERLERTTGRSHRYLRHRRIARLSQKLCQIGRPNDCVL